MKNNQLIKGICNPSLNTIYHDVFVHKACPIKSASDHFIGLLISSFTIKSCLGRETFPLAYVEVYTKDTIPDCKACNKLQCQLIWEWSVSPFKVRKLKKKKSWCKYQGLHISLNQYSSYLTFVPTISKTSDWISLSVIRLMWPFRTWNKQKNIL